MIYARCSIDLQCEASIGDQVRICRQRLDREDWSRSEPTAMPQASAPADSGRGIEKLLEDARVGAFGVVVAEAPDWLSRDMKISRPSATSYASAASRS